MTFAAWPWARYLIYSGFSLHQKNEIILLSHRVVAGTKEDNTCKTRVLSKHHKAKLSLAIVTMIIINYSYPRYMSEHDYIFFLFTQLDKVLKSFL